MHEALRPVGELGPLRDPVLIAAFSGFSDASGAAVATIEYLAQEWQAAPLAEIDPEPFYDFTVQRPTVRLEDDRRVIDWPTNKLYVARPAAAERDLVLLAGIEPHTRWRMFIEMLADLMAAVGARTSITLGAQPAPVPHTRPLPITLSASDASFEEQFGLEVPVSRYEGPTGIVGVFNVHQRSLQWRNASLWVQVPHYLTVGPDPNAIRSLVAVIDRGFGTHTSIEPLLARQERFEEQVREALQSSREAEGYIRQLEEQYDSSKPALPAPLDAQPAELPTSEEILHDLEQFLREQRDSE